MNYSELCDKVLYKLTFDNGLTIIGPVDKVSQHFCDFEGHTFTFNPDQPEDIKPIMDKYFMKYGYDIVPGVLEGMCKES